MRWRQDTYSAFVHLYILCVQFCAQVLVCFIEGMCMLIVNLHCVILHMKYGELKVVQILNLNDQTDVHW